MQCWAYVRVECGMTWHDHLAQATSEAVARDGICRFNCCNDENVAVAVQKTHAAQSK